jgi:hypothetical protein
MHSPSSHDQINEHKRYLSQQTKYDQMKKKRKKKRKNSK